MTVRKFSFVLLSLLLSFSLYAQSKAGKNSFKKDNILVEYVPVNGGVNLFYVNDKNQKFSVLDNVDFGKSSFTGVQIDKTYFNMKTSGGVTPSVKIDDNSLSITYRIGNKIELCQTYTVPEKNILNIRYTIRNVSKDEHTVSVKSIFDTCLGEWNGTPFSTESKQKINNEYIITNFQKHKSLTSTDGVTGIRFRMDKKFENIAYKCVVAAKPFFENDSFDNHFVEGRGFNTVLSYNNACVGFFFKSRTIKPDAESAFDQRIEFAQAVITSFKKIEDDNEDEKNHRFIEEENEENAKSVEVIKNPSVEESSSTVPAVSDNIEKQTDAKPVETVESITTVENAEQNESVSMPGNQQPVFEQIGAVKEKKNIDRAYARELIAKIKSLEDSGENTSRQEIVKLQSELNEILRQLKDE